MDAAIYHANPTHFHDLIDNDDNDMIKAAIYSFQCVYV